MTDAERRLNEMIDISLSGPCRSFEDVPLNLCLYEILQVENGAVVVRNSGQVRDGIRWGMSQAYTPGEQHYMLPNEFARVQLFKAPILLTGAQPFDFIYHTGSLVERLERDAHTDRSIKDKIEVVRVPLRDLRDHYNTILDDQTFTTTHSWREQFNVLMHNDRLDSLEKFHAFAARDAIGNTIGFALLWNDGETCFHVHRYLFKAMRKHTRFFDYSLADFASDEYLCEVNIGDAHRTTGLMQYKMELRPFNLGHYVHALYHVEMMDHERPSSTVS